jgi:uncharacterized protein YyaL (SSP411 family)
MEEFVKFKKQLGYTTQEIAKATGYTRQGLYNAFNILSQGKIPGRKFLVCINAAIEKRMQEETKAYEDKMNKLRELQGKFNVEG